MVQKLADRHFPPEAFINRRVPELFKMRDFHNDSTVGLKVFCKKSGTEAPRAQRIQNLILALKSCPDFKHFCIGPSNGCKSLFPQKVPVCHALAKRNHHTAANSKA